VPNTLRGICHFHSETGTEGGYWAFQDSQFINGKYWSYGGLHILRDGDRLTIYSPDQPDQIVWSGIIALQRHPLFTEHVHGGWWIHADQIGQDRETWAKYFFEEYPAELTSTDR